MPDNSIKIGLWNARSIKNKINEVKILTEEFDILCITETWLSNKHNGLNIKGYNLYRNDRQESPQGGGVCILIKNNIKHRANTIRGQEMKETNTVAITIYNSEKEIDIVASYRKPGLKWNKQNWINLFNNKRKNVDTIFIGDYNAKSPLWNCVNTNGDGRILEEVLMESNLFIGNFDTISRIGDERSNPSNIDLFITTMNIIGKSQYRNTGEQWGSDHFILEMKLFDNIIHCNKKKGNKKPYNDVTMNWPKFREIIESKLNYIIDEIGNRVQKYEQTIQDRYNTLETIIKEAIIKTQEKDYNKLNPNAESCNNRTMRNNDSSQHQRNTRGEISRKISIREVLHGGIKNAGKRGKTLKKLHPSFIKILP